MLRRVFLQGLTVLCTIPLVPLRALAQRNRAAFSATRLERSLAELFPGQQISPAGELVRIDIATSVEHGAVVPIRVNTDLSGVRRIVILAEKNPNPLIASFSLAPNCSGFIATRIKLGEATDVIAVVETEEQLYRQTVFVDVKEGGCA